MKLQLKRSNQVTGLPGSEVALPPTAANTEFGEISVNYNEYDPALFCKLDNGDIVRLGGANDDYLLTSSGTATTGQIVLTHNPIGTKASTTDSISITGGTGVTVDGSTGNTINITIDGGSDIGVDLSYTAGTNNGVINNTAGDDVTIPTATGGVRAGLISSVNQQKLDRVIDPGAGQTTDDRYVNSAGDSMTGNLELSNNSKIVFEGSSADNFETILTAIDPTADNTLSLPNVSGNLVSTGDTGTVTSTMITDQTIVNDDINNSANISVSKLGEGTANQVLVTDAAGNNVVWANDLNLSGSITTAGIATFNGGISADGAFSVANDSGNVSTTGTLTVSQLATFNGGISADGAFSVVNDSGNVSTTGSLDVSGLSSLDGGIDVDGAFTVSDTTGNISTTGTLTVSQLATFNGGISADGAFSVVNDSGNVSTTGSLDVSGLSSLDGGIDVDGAFTVSDTSGNISTTGTLTVSQLATFNGGISADGAFSVINDSGNVSTTGSLDVSGLSSLDGGIDVDGAFIVSDTTGNVSTTGSLTVSQLATFNGGIAADGAFSVVNDSGNVSTTGTLDVSGLSSLDGGIDVDGVFTVSDTTGNISTTGTLSVSGLISADGKISFPLGSQTVPSLYPGSDSNTGIYSPGADTLAITTSGVERARFSSNGNFGINATNPLSLLQVGQARFEVTGLTAERIYTYPDAAGTVALTSSNVATASAWATARTITLGGDTSGSVSLDGSSNVTLDITVTDDSHNHTIANVDSLQTTLDAKADLVGGVIPTSQIPALAITEFLGSVSSQSAMLALSGQKGDWCNRTDVSSTFIITGADPTQISSWTELDYPSGDVTSVNSQTGAVVIGASDLGLGNVDNTSDLNKPISTATQTALNGKLGSTANAASASQWNTARTITLGTDLSGSVSIDGSSNVTLNATVADDSHNHIIANVDGLQAALNGKLGSTAKAADSELLDGINSTSFLRSDAANTFTSTITGSTLILGGSQIMSSSASFQVNGFSRMGTVYLHDLTNNVDSPLTNNNGTLQWNANQVWTSANDGSGSGLDADLLDGQQSSFYQNASNLNSGTIPDARISDIGNSQARIITFDNLEKGDFGGDGQLGFDSSQGLLVYRAQQGTSGATTTVLDGWNVAAGTNISITNLGSGDTGTNEFTFSVTQGSGSGLDADLLDGVQGANYVRNNSTTTISARHRFNHNEINNSDTIATSTGSLGALEVYNSGSGNDAFMSFHAGGDHACYFGLDADTNDLSVGGWSKGANKYKIWHAGNDGSGSGLDADTLDGAQPSAAASNSTIVQRHSSGYIYANYFNTTPNDVSSGITRICCETGNDGFIRHATAGAVQGFIGASVTGTANSMAKRDGSGDVYARLFRSTYGNQSTISGGIAYRVSTTDNYIRFCSDAGAVRTFLGAAPSASPTFTGDLTIPGAIIHSGDSNTYIQFHGNDLFRVVIAGAEVQEWGNNYTLLSDNDQLRLGTGSDFRMYFNGADTYFRNYAHTNGDIIFQGETSNGTNQNLLIMKTDGPRTYNILYEHSQERFRTTSAGVTVTGAITATGDITAFSDIKLKGDIKVITNALDKVSKIRGITYTRNDVEDKTRKAGVIAQEVEKVLPEVVTTTEDGTKKVAYGNIVGLLIESIKELKAEIETLKEGVG